MLHICFMFDTVREASVCACEGLEVHHNDSHRPFVLIQRGPPLQANLPQAHWYHTTGWKTNEVQCF